MRLLLATSTALLTILAHTPAATADTYVDRGSLGGACSDSRTAAQAASAASPWCSLTKAANAAPDGSTVQVRAGPYPALTISGNDNASTIAFRAYGSETPSIDGLSLQNSSRWRFEGFAITDHSSLANGTTDVELVDNDISPGGVSLLSAYRTLIERNRIHDIPLSIGNGTGIWVNFETSDVEQCCDDTGIVIRANRFDRIENDAIQLGGGTNDAVVEDNLFTNIRPTGGAHGDAFRE